MTSIVRIFGNILGLLMVPFLWLVTWLRQKRPIHSYGSCMLAEVRPSSKLAGLARDIAQKLKGSALVRLSSTLWRDFEFFDGLGCAVRFHNEKGSQDILFATTRHIWSLPGALIVTNARDFFGNDYYAVVPYQWQQYTFKLRLTPKRMNYPGSRKERLLRQLEAKTAWFTLQIQVPKGQWQPCVEIHLKSLLADQPSLHFDPLSSGLGLSSRSLIQQIRKWVYPRSH